MSTTTKLNYKTLLAALGLFFTGIVAAYLFEHYYRKLVRYLFKMFNGDNIQFFGKDFHLFPNESFLIAFGLFTSLTFLFLRFSARQFRMKRSILMVVTFFATTILITTFDSKRLIFECTNREEGIRRLTFNQPPYDTYFIISLSTSAIYMVATYLVERSRLRKPINIM